MKRIFLWGVVVISLFFSSYSYSAGFFDFLNQWSSGKKSDTSTNQTQQVPTKNNTQEQSNLLNPSASDFSQVNTNSQAWEIANYGCTLAPSCPRPPFERSIDEPCPGTREGKCYFCKVTFTENHYWTDGRSVCPSGFTVEGNPWGYLCVNDCVRRCDREAFSDGSFSSNNLAQLDRCLNTCSLDPHRMADEILCPSAYRVNRGSVTGANPIMNRFLNMISYSCVDRTFDEFADSPGRMCTQCGSQFVMVDGQKVICRQAR